MNTSHEGMVEIKATEAFRQFAYPDPYSDLAQKYPGKRWGFAPADYIFASLPDSAKELSGAPWTIGYGYTEGVTKNDTMTQEEADLQFPRKLVPYERAVERGCKIKPTQKQFDAMVSLCYNIGAARFTTSTVLRCHNEGDFLAASRAFGLFNKSKGKVSSGLTLRRQKEAAMYLAGSKEVVEPEPQPMPQNVDAERPMASSTINRASVAAGTTATVAGVSEVVRTISDTKTSIESLGTWLVPVLCIAVVGLCAYIIYERYKQRKQGWA